jgi:hypothetical protein
MLASDTYTCGHKATSGCDVVAAGGLASRDIATVGVFASACDGWLLADAASTRGQRNVGVGATATFGVG